MASDIRRALRKLSPVMLKAQQDNLNEADTVQRLVMFFEQVLGYDPLTEITREAQVKDKYVDIAIKIDGAVKFLVEAKAAGIDLRDRHIEQAKAYAAEANIRWVVLTNGVIWSLYHLTFEEGLEYERLFLADLASQDIDEAAALLALLHRREIRAEAHEEFWTKHTALSPQSLAKSLYTDTTLRAIRRDIRKREGILIDEEDLAAAFHGMFTPEAREQIGPVKIRRQRSPRHPKTAAAPAGAPSQATGTESDAAPTATSKAVPETPEAAPKGAKPGS